MKGVASGLNGSGEVKIGGVKTCELTPLSYYWLFFEKHFYIKTIQVFSNGELWDFKPFLWDRV